MTHRSLAVLVITLAAALTAPAPAMALVHLWDIAEIYSNADGSVQFVELFTKGSGEVGTQLGKLDSDGNTVTLDGPLTDTPTTNRSFLIATPGFAGLAGGVTPDTTMPVAPFFAVEGDTLIFQTVNEVAIYDMVLLLSGDVPLDGVLSLHRENPGGTTPADPPGDFLPADNSPTNYAGDVGSLMLPEPGSGLLGMSSLLFTASLVRLARIRPVRSRR